MTKLFRLPFNLNFTHFVGLAVSAVLLVSSYLFFGKSNPNLFYFLVGISFVIGGFPFFVSIIIEGRVNNNKETMFLEFSRGLVESVKAGTPISKSILNIRNKDYGSLNPHINKLANQISLGIPIKTSFETFARDIGSKTISRSVNIMSESEKAGGRIDEILDSIVRSVSQVERLKKERKAAMYSLVVQGYIIFIIFIAIMLVMEFKILPIASEMGSQLGTSSSGGISAAGGFGAFFSGERASPEQMARPFLWLLIVQGFFAGLVIGKLSEGSMKAGLKHSFILLVISLLIQTGVNLFLGSPIKTPIG